MRHVALLLITLAVLFTGACAAPASDDDVVERADFRQKGTDGYRMTR